MTETSENLQKYEEMFAQRFTSDDHEYQQYLSRPSDPPPIVEDWRSRGGGSHRGRDNRYQDRRGHGWGGGRGWGGDRGWRGDRPWRGDYRGPQHWQDRDRDRDRDRDQDRDRDRDRNRDRDWDRDRDRDRDRYSGHGSGYQSGPPGSNQGYNSHHQRPHYDRY